MDSPKGECRELNIIQIRIYVSASSLIATPACFGGGHPVTKVLYKLMSGEVNLGCCH